MDPRYAEIDCSRFMKDLVEGPTALTRAQMEEIGGFSSLGQKFHHEAEMYSTIVCAHLYAAWFLAVIF
jgi:hypothetical protein